MSEATTNEAISIELDHDADVAYIALGEERDVVETVGVTSQVNVDLDEFGVAVGIEVLSFDAEIPWNKLVRDYHVHSSVEGTVTLVAPSVRGFLTGVQYHAAGKQSAPAPRAQLRPVA